MYIRKKWSESDIEYLSENWGTKNMDYLSKKLKRSVNAIQQKAQKLKLGAYLDNGEYITVNSLVNELGASSSHTLKQWLEKGLPIKQKKVKNSYFKIIYIEDFWEWASKNKTIINFSKIDHCYIGIPPEWVKDKIRADKEYYSFFKRTPWTSKEDKELINLVNQYKYGYYEISQRLKRTEGAIKRRLVDLKFKGRPIKRDNHTLWTNSEVEKLIFYFEKGFTSDVISMKLNGTRSSQSCKGKIENLIKERILKPRSEFRKSC